MDEEIAAPVKPDTAAQLPADDKAQYEGPKWLADLPEDVRGDKSLTKYTSVESAARGLINAQRMIGMDKVPRPKGDFDPASPEWQPFLDALGRPKDAAGYEFPEVQLPEGMTYDKPLEEKFKSVAHGLGLNPKQAQGLRDFFAAYQGEAFTGQVRDFDQERQASEATLKQELGQAYDGYIEASKAAMKEYMSPEFVGFLEKSGLGNHPEMVRTFGKIGRETLGDAKLKAAGVSVAPSPNELRSQIMEFRTKHQAALYDNTHPDNKRLAAELFKMTEKLYPEPTP